MGKQIRIYLANDSAIGIRHAEITNWTGQALACPRPRFPELREWEEVRRPGVYFLFGVDDETGADVAYIGEAETVIERIASHVAAKSFWEDVVAFTSKDENLTKAHVRYLEARLLELAKTAGRYRLENTVTPQLPLLPRADRAAMEDFLDSLKLLLGALGYRLLEPLLPMRITAKASNWDSAILASLDTTSERETSILDADLPAFRLSSSGLTANAIRTDEGIVVLAESDAALAVGGSLTGGLVSLRDGLIASGVLAPSGDKYRFTKHQLFKSPSQAATVVVGYPINGRKYWRLTNDGTTFGEYEQQFSNAMLDELTKQAPLREDSQ